MGLTGTVAATLGHAVLLADLEQDALLFAQLNTIRFGSRARTRRLNWQKDRLDERFDLILGADVLYDKAQWPHLEPFWRHHLAGEGCVLLGEPGRQTGDLVRRLDRRQRLAVRKVPRTRRDAPQNRSDYSG